MKRNRLILLTLLFLLAGAVLALIFNSTMGITIEPRDVMPASPPVTHDPSASQSPLPLPWVMFDPGAVGIEPDTAAWMLGDDDHEQRRFTSLFRPAPEYIDQETLKEYREDLRDYLHLIRGMGANALEFPMFLELVDFDRLGTGTNIYGQDDPMRQRQEAYREAFGSMFRLVDSMGFHLVLSSDMVVLTPELETWLKDQPVGMNTAEPGFWKAYQAGFSELFDRFPMIDAMQIRVGEAGSFYNRPNWPYRSELWVDDIDEVRSMLSALLVPCREHGKKLIFRSWTVGMGSVGELHTDTEVYEEVFRDFDDPGLWISTKWVQGDFYPFTPYNPTLSTGAQGRIIEYQVRREYEAFCSYPLWIVPYEQYALQRALADNERIQGFWIWTQYGGPIRRSPMTLFPHTGDLKWIELNAAGTAALAYNPYLDTDSLLQVLLDKHFDADTTAMEVLVELLNESHHISRSGLAFPTAVNYLIRGLGTDVPPGIYTYWDRVLASTVVNGILYYAGADQYAELVKDLEYPVRALKSYRSRLEQLSSHMDPAALAGIMEDLDYEISLFSALQIHKAWVFHHNRYLHTGDKKAFAEYNFLADELPRTVKDHEKKYLHNLDHRAFTFGDALREVELSQRAAHHKGLRWLLLAGQGFVVLFLFYRMKGMTPAWLAPLLVLGSGGLAKLDALSSAWAILMLIAALIYMSTALFLSKKRMQDRRTWNRSWAMLVILQIIAQAFSVWRGPMALGYWFWTSNVFRIIFLSLSTGIIGLHIVLLSRALKSLAPWLISFGIWLATVAAGLGAFWSTLDERLTVINWQAALLPNSIVHTWGFEQMFELPPNLVDKIAIAGLAIAIIAGLLFRISSRLNGLKDSNGPE